MLTVILFLPCPSLFVGNSEWNSFECGVEFIFAKPHRKFFTRIKEVKSGWRMMPCFLLFARAKIAQTVIQQLVYVNKALVHCMQCIHQHSIKYCWECFIGLGLIPELNVRRVKKLFAFTGICSVLSLSLPL